MDPTLQAELAIIFGPGPYGGQKEVLSYMQAKREEAAAERQAKREEAERQAKREEREHKLALEKIRVKENHSARDHDLLMAMLIRQTKHATASYAQFFVEQVAPNLELFEIKTLVNAPSKPSKWANKTANALKGFRENPKESQLQEFLFQAFKEALKAVKTVGDDSMVLTAFDTHRQEYLRGCRPDISFAMQGSSNVHAGNVVLIMKIKAGSKNLFTDAERGQLFFALRAVLEVNPTRAWIYGVLMCADIFCVLKAQRRIEQTNIKTKSQRKAQPSWIGIEYLYSATFSANERGLEILLGFLNLQPQTLGWSMRPLPAVPGRITKKCNPDGFLGSGLTADVYAYPSNSGLDDLVAKCFHSEFESIFHHESVILNLLREVERVPRLIHQDEEEKVLVLSPRGIEVPIEPMRPHYLKQNHIKDLITILENAHSLDIVHRDIRLSNLMFVWDPNLEDYSVMISDWGFAMETKYTEIHSSPNANFYGTLNTACPEILDALLSAPDWRVAEPKPSHDLQALVRTLYLYRYEAGRRKMQTIVGTGSNINQLKEFWEAALAVEPWNEFEKLAENCNYDKLRAELGVFVQELP